MSTLDYHVTAVRTETSPLTFSVNPTLEVPHSLSLDFSQLSIEEMVRSGWRRDETVSTLHVVFLSGGGANGPTSCSRSALFY